MREPAGATMIHEQESVVAPGVAGVVTRRLPERVTVVREVPEPQRYWMGAEEGLGLATTEALTLGL